MLLTGERAYAEDMDSEPYKANKEKPSPFHAVFLTRLLNEPLLQLRLAFQRSVMVWTHILSFWRQTNSSAFPHLVVPGLVSSGVLCKGKFPRVHLCQDFREQDACKFYCLHIWRDHESTAGRKQKKVSQILQPEEKLSTGFVVTGSQTESLFFQINLLCRHPFFFSIQVSTRKPGTSYCSF